MQLKYWSVGCYAVILVEICWRFNALAFRSNLAFVKVDIPIYLVLREVPKPHAVIGIGKDEGQPDEYDT